MKNSWGYSLVELIVSIAILLIFVVPLSSMIVFSSKVSMYSGDQLSCSSELQIIFEEVKSGKSLDNLFLDGEEHLHPSNNSISYIIEPVSAYSVSGNDILYKVILTKLLKDNNKYTLSGTIVPNQGGIISNGGIEE